MGSSCTDSPSVPQAAFSLAESLVNAPGHTGGRSATAATILNVNDHPATLYLVSQTLRLAGYQVTEATTGGEALAIAVGQPDLVLLDVHLPDIDGYEVCRRLRAQP